MSIPWHLPSLATLLLAVAACGSAGPSGPGAGTIPPTTPPAAPTSAPSTGPIGAIDHPTGATDVVLRYEESGGFVPIEWFASSAPIFTLYGDGRIIFRDPRLDPLPNVGSVRPLRPLRTARMNEDQIQALLGYALGPGGLGIARPTYPNDLVADASNAVFTVRAGGVAKTVTVYALGLESNGVPDIPARQGFLALRDHLVNIHQGGSIKTDVYAPDRYRAILQEGQAGVPAPHPWPWPEIKVAGFVIDSAPTAVQLPARVLTVAEVERLGVTPYQGGFTGLPLTGPGDGKSYSLSLRPLFPDETR